MKKILFLSTIASLVTVLFYSCNRNTPKDSESISSKEFSQIELPKGTNLSINSIQIYENGGKKKLRLTQAENLRQMPIAC